MTRPEAVAGNLLKLRNQEALVVEWPHGALSDRWNVFWSAVGTRRYGLADIGKLAAAIIAAAYFWWYHRELTTLEIWLAVALVVFVLLFWIMLEYGLKLTRQISDARLRLAHLRVTGVELRNEALDSIRDKRTFRAWERKVLAWNTEVQSEIEKISKSDAVWFSVLDIVLPPRISPVLVPSDPSVAADFLKLFREHDFRVRRLGKMIRDLWGRI
jgi:hypothetical protein